MPSPIIRSLSFASLVLLLAGCGGGGSSSPALPATAGSGTTLAISVPSGAIAAANRRFEQSASAPIAMTVKVGTATPVTLALAPTNPACLSDGKGGLVCTTPLTAAAGTQSLAWTMTAGSDGSGAALATGTVPITVASNAATNIAVTLAGAVASLSIALSQSTGTAGTAATSSVLINAMDSSGKTIVGNSTYVDAGGNAVTIALSNSDRSGATFLSKSQLTAPSDGATFQYSGSAAVTATIGASASVTTAAGSVQLAGVATVNTAFTATGTAAASAGGVIGALPVSGSPIQHVIIVVMENRTFDNLFQGFPGADTASSGLAHDGSTVALQPRPFELPPDPSHERSSLLVEYDNAKMDGFDLDPVGSSIAGPPNLPSPSTYVYGYVPQAETAPYWLLAQHFAVSDRMFASQMAPSFPGHQYLIAGQSGRAIGDPVNATNPVSQLQVNAVWGCDSPAGSTVELLDGANNNVLPGPFPCFDYQTLGDLLDAGHVSWKYYTGFSNGLDLDGQVSAYDAIRHIRYGNDWTTKVSSPEYTFFADVAGGVLPSVTWITPPAAASDHAGSMNSSGPSWVSAIYNAIATSPYYANTAIFVTWDDSGGWYDHVAPPQFNGLELGFRVPLIAISPYVKTGYVSHVNHDYGSILHFVEKNYGLGNLGTVDARADDLSDLFNYSQPKVSPLSLTAPYSLADIKALHATHPVDDDH